MTPRRTCIGCQNVGAPGLVSRVVLAPDGGVVWSPVSAGRGAWLCTDSPSCIAAAIQKRAFSRALRAEIVGDPQEQLQPGPEGVRG